tara:strand:- start:141 stop:2339 length:2199 start_codon:yes stop_codon:yes gene_type:complete
MNKVLNRPLFRKEALRKGAIKPIHAQTGIMVGQPINNPNPQINPRTPVPAIRPNIMRRAIGDLRAFVQRPGQFFNPKVNRFRPGAGTAMFLGVEGLAPIIGAGRRKLGLSDESALAPFIDYGLGGLLTMTPIGRAVGLTALAGRTALGAKDYVQGKKIGTTMSALSPNLGEPLGLFDRPISGATARRKSRRGETSAITLDDIAKADEQGFTVSPRKRARQGQQTTDVATLPQNTTQIGKDKTIDTAKIAENAITPNPQLDFPMVSMPEQPKVPGVKEKDKNLEKLDKPKTDPDSADLDTIRANSPLMEQLKLARQIRDELSQGRSSQAKLIFLSNLASGLLTGTTKKAGLGGALEVFGQAIGPAVNNMVMVKMKEDEIEQQLMGRALEFSTDFLKAQNQAIEMPDTLSAGVIQYTNAAGRTVNKPGRILEDGTKQVADGVDRRTGLTIFRTVDPNLNFIPNDDQNKETLDLAKQIAGKYAAVNLINRSLGIIAEGKAEAGVTGAIGLYGGRLTEALGDVLDFVKIGGDDIDVMNSQGKATFEAQTLKAAADLAAMEPEKFKSVEAARNFLENKKKGIGKYKDFKGSALKDAQKRLEGGSKLDYERLAINETVLVYKLANSLKSKDRLTQKDIEMAKNLVKVFPLLRGDKNVRASLIAVAETILDDIKQQERLYERAGGSSQYLLDERKAYDLVPQGTTLNTFTETFDSLKKTEKDINKLTEEDLKIIFPGLK